MRLTRKDIISIEFIIICAILLNLLPYFVSGVPLQDQVLSDVESHISTWQISTNPSLFSKDKILRTGLNVSLSKGQLLFDHFLGFIAKSLNIDLFTFSVFLSFCSLVFFLIGLYLLLLFSLKDRLLAFLITLISIIPVHALGAVTFGFQALGFLPRDLAAAVAVFILLLYFYAIEYKNRRNMGLVFLISGLLANFYPTTFFQLALTLSFAELIRTRKINMFDVTCGGLFILGATPTIGDILLKTTSAIPVDVEIMKSFYRYMMASPTWDTVRQYLRRFLIYAFLTPIIYFFLIRKATESDKPLLKPWIALAISSFSIAIVGVYMESATSLSKYMMSRTSVWFILSAMVIISYGMRILYRQYPVKKSALLIAVTLSMIFLFQSNLPTTYRFLRDTYNNRVQTKDFHIAVSKLKQMTKEDDLILAPSDEFNDLAAKVRTYSLRSIFVCYKYGGISIMDGALGREWREKYQKLTDVFKDKNPKTLIDFMEREQIHYAFIPAYYYSKNDPHLQGHIAAYTEHFLIIKI